MRSLERQVELWNKNSTVNQAGVQLQQTMIKVLGDASYPESPTGVAAAAFARKLSAQVVTPEPSSAAPGTSDHGRGIAVDLVVMKDRTIVANTYTSHVSTKWEKDGWGAKLVSACAGTRLKGPLQVPFEPWHWVLGP